MEEKDTVVLLHTTEGNIKIKLYGNTPIHRDNFVTHVKDGVYDSVLFHRVINEFMIQAGDPSSKTAVSGTLLGASSAGEELTAEFVPEYFHKKGAIAAARASDAVNPEKKSSGSQFYIVTGTFYTEMELDKWEKEKNIKFTPEQREAYMMEGGRPDLDNQYTVFGEVISGMKTVFKIQMVETNDEDRPKKNIKIKSMKIVEK